MRVINERAGVHLESMAEGETFFYEDDYWLITDYADDNDKTLCVSLKSGFTAYLPKERIVTPITAEAHIL